jgi:hypothetical protein
MKNLMGFTVGELKQFIEDNKIQNDEMIYLECPSSDVTFRAVRLEHTDIVSNKPALYING